MFHGEALFDPAVVKLAHDVAPLAECILKRGTLHENRVGVSWVGDDDVVIEGVDNLALVRREVVYVELVLDFHDKRSACFSISLRFQQYVCLGS